MSEVIPLTPTANISKFIIGYIHNGNVRQSFMQSCLNFTEYNANHRKLPYAYIDRSGLYLADNRNAIADQFLRLYKGTDWLIFFDTDIEFKPETIYKLLDAADPVERPIVSGLYFTYFGPNHMLTSSIVPIWSNYTEGKGFELVPKIYANEIQQIDGTGFGCIIIHRKVLEKFKQKYPEPFVWFGHDPIKVGGTILPLGEDYTFCKRAKDMGIPIFGHGDAVVTHHKMTPLSLETILAYNQAEFPDAKFEGE